MNKIRYFFIMLLLFSTLSAWADSVVIEVLASSKENKFWNPKKSMHLTIGHVKNVEGADIVLAVRDFNKIYNVLLEKNLKPGFTVKNFTTNGFNKGFNILEADEETDKRLSAVNKELYKYLLNNYSIKMTDITSPKNVYPTGYTPHFEFLPRSNNQIPSKGNIINFVEYQLSARIHNFDREID